MGEIWKTFITFKFIAGIDGLAVWRKVNALLPTVERYFGVLAGQAVVGWPSHNRVILASLAASHSVVLTVYTGLVILIEIEARLASLTLSSIVRLSFLTVGGSDPRYTSSPISIEISLVAREALSLFIIARETVLMDL